METVTISKKEYMELLEIKRNVEKKTQIKRNAFDDRSFGKMKNGFGKVSSAVYVSRLRSSWR